MIYRVALTLLSLAVGVTPAWAAKDRAVAMKPDIAAVVGGDVVSTYDVDNRVRFIVISGKLPDTREVKDKVRPQILRTLIDEKLQIAEAKKHGIAVIQSEVQEAIAGIEKDRNMPAGAVFAMLERHNLPPETFTNQIEAQLAWRKLVLQKLRPQVRISDEEARLARFSPSANNMPQELKIAVLTLPVDKPAREREVLETAARLAKEVRAGASFEEVTRQLSGRASGNADEAFWVRPEQLDPQLARALAGAASGTITEPIRTQVGYTIVKVQDARLEETDNGSDSELTFKEIVLKLEKGASQQEADALLAIAEEVAKHPGSCAEKGVAGIDSLGDVNIEVNKRSEALSKLPKGVQTVMNTLTPGDISTPFAGETGIRLYMLCARKEMDMSEEALAKLKNQIYQQKIELQAQKYLRNLRRTTFIEIR